MVTSRTYSIRLTANLRAQIDSGDPELSFGCLTTLLASIGIEIIAIFCGNNPILRKFDFFDPLWPQIWSHQKNDISIFCRTCHGLSNAVYRLSLSFLVFEFSGGGGGHHSTKNTQIIFWSGQIWGHRGPKKGQIFSKSGYFRRKTQLSQ